MFPIGDEHETLRTPVMTYAIIATIVAVWFLVQGAGLPGSESALATSVCNLGMVPGELTARRRSDQAFRSATAGRASSIARGSTSSLP